MSSASCVERSVWDNAFSPRSYQFRSRPTGHGIAADESFQQPYCGAPEKRPFITSDSTNSCHSISSPGNCTCTYGRYDRLDRAVFLRRDFWDTHPRRDTLDCVPVVETALAAFASR